MRRRRWRLVDDCRQQLDRRATSAAWRAGCLERGDVAAHVRHAQRFGFGNGHVASGWVRRVRWLRAAERLHSATGNGSADGRQSSWISSAEFQFDARLRQYV
jgi:hypothetical protein